MSGLWLMHMSFLCTCLCVCLRCMWAYACRYMYLDVHVQRSMLDVFHTHPPPWFLRWGIFLNLELSWQTKGPRNHGVYGAVAIGELAATPTLSGCSLSLPPTVPRYKHTYSLAIGALAVTPTLTWLLGIQACAASALSHCTSSKHQGWLLQASLSQVA